MSGLKNIKKKNEKKKSYLTALKIVGIFTHDFVIYYAESVVS